jgi:uncharacterized protein
MACYNTAFAAKRRQRMRLTMPRETSPKVPQRKMAMRTFLLLLTLLGGCAQKPVDDNLTSSATVIAAPTATDTALGDLGNMNVAQANSTAVAWAGDYLSAGRLDAAQLMIDWIKPAQLTDAQLLDWVLIKGKLLLAKQDPSDTLALLAQDNVRAAQAKATPQSAARLTLLRADALTLKGDLYASVEARVDADQRLADDQRPYNRQMIWTQLMLLPADELQSAQQQTRHNELKGWLELAGLYRDPLIDIDTQISQFDQWQSTWPGHPAAENLPGMIQALRQAVKDRPQSIAVLLPLNGPLASAAAAVRDGLLTAYYSALNQHYPVPQILFYDSGSNDVIALYNQALDAGAELIIGPLDKEQVSALSTISSLPVPTLALNYVDMPDSTTTPPHNLYQFGLAPEDEARQAAEQAITEGARLAAILYPEGNWGARVAEAFREKFESLGGIVTAKSTFAQDATGATRALLDLGQSQARARALNRLTSLKVEFEPRRRQDIDLIFIVANADQARQLKPALNFNYASDLPVFAISQVYAGTPSAAVDSDLNGIRFIDLPWLFDQESPLHQDAASVWPNGHGRYERLFAMGVDAYRLHARLSMLQSVPDSFLPGVTGQLSIDPQRKLVRQLQWAYFTHGKPQRMPVVHGSGENSVGNAVVAPAAVPATR